MIRKSLAIFFLLVLICMQFGRTFSYLECRIDQALNVTTTCDCEKQVGQDITSDQQASSLKLISKEMPEDLIAGSNAAFGGFHTYQIILVSTRNPRFALQDGFNVVVFQPPKLEILI